MTQPASGDVWPNIYGYNTANLRKALYGSILVRDWDAVNTSLAFTADSEGVWQSGFTPFAADGTLRPDLLKEVGGTYYDLGAGSSDGPSFQNSFDVQKDHIWQTRQVVRTDITSEEGTMQFGMVEYSTLADTLEFDLPLASTPPQGTPGYARKKPNEMEGRIRQVLAIGVDKNLNYFVDVFPWVSLENLDDRRWSAEELINLMITWSISIDPHSGYSQARFRGGSGWEANPGVPVFLDVPVAAAQAGGAVAVVFSTPIGPEDPFVYTAEKTDVGTGITTVLNEVSVQLDTPTVGQVTYNGDGLATGEDYTTQITATNAVGGASKSAPSNVVTGLA